MNEVVNVGELRWLEGWKDSKDKKAFLTKVSNKHDVTNPNKT